MMGHLNCQRSKAEAAKVGIRMRRCLRDGNVEGVRTEENEMVATSTEGIAPHSAPFNGGKGAARCCQAQR